MVWGSIYEQRCKKGFASIRSWIYIFFIRNDSFWLIKPNPFTILLFARAARQSLLERYPAHGWAPPPNSIKSSARSPFMSLIVAGKMLSVRAPCLWFLNNNEKWWWMMTRWSLLGNTTLSRMSILPSALSQLQNTKSAFLTVRIGLVRWKGIPHPAADEVRPWRYTSMPPLHRSHIVAKKQGFNVSKIYFAFFLQWHHTSSHNWGGFFFGGEGGGREVGILRTYAKVFTT